jgi:Rrf2 family protein
MKISNRTLYGLKFMIRLASTYEVRIIALNEIAEEENISVKFLENIVSAIKVKNLIQVKRGAKGGYYLTRAPSKINLKEIFDALEADIINNEWLRSEAHSLTDVVVQNCLKELDALIRNFFEKKTLEDILREYEKMKPGQMFYI